VVNVAKEAFRLYDAADILPWPGRCFGAGRRAIAAPLETPEWMS
jgi:hypothetical protein